MIKTGVVQVSGRGTNVDFTIDDAGTFSHIIRGLREYLVDNRGLWSRGNITVNVGRRMLSRKQLGEIQQVLEAESGLTVTRFWCSPEALVGSAEADNPEFWAPNSNGGKELGPRPKIAEQAAAAPPASPVTQKTPEPANAAGRKGRRADALFIKTTCRSGESIRHPGDVVVLADVNPGAEIMADGDVVVFGRLRGVAHAGASGDAKAAIIAYRLAAPRLQIGPYIGLASKSDQRSKSTETGPQIAYVRRRSIYVAHFAGRFARYGRGILYDG